MRVVLPLIRRHGPKFPLPGPSRLAPSQNRPPTRFLSTDTGRPLTEKPPKESPPSSVSGAEDLSQSKLEESTSARTDIDDPRIASDAQSGRPAITDAFKDDETRQRQSSVEATASTTEGNPQHTVQTLPRSILATPYTIDNPARKTLPGRRASMSITPASWTADQATRPLLLTLDAFGTLFEPSTSIQEQYSEVAARYGFDIEPSAILVSFKKAFKAQSASHPNYGRRTDMAVEFWWSQVIHSTLSPLLPAGSELPNELVEDLYTRFATSDGYNLFPDVFPLLSNIGTCWSPAAWPPQRTMLGIVSNSDPRVRSILDSFDIPILPSLFPPRYAPHSKRFHVDFGPATLGFATLSYECQYAKPDRLIYSAAVRDAQYSLNSLAYVAKLTRSGLDSLQDVRKEFHCMHVGDELEKDVLPAIQCGWDGVLLDREASEELSYRDVSVPGDKEASIPAGDAGNEKMIKIPVINSLLALRHLVTKERFETAQAQPLQRPVYYDDGMLGSDAVRSEADRKKYGKNRDYTGRRVVPHPVSRHGEQLWMLE